MKVFRLLQIVLATTAFLVAILVFSIGGEYVSRFMAMQFGPAFVSLATGFTEFALTAVVLTLAATVVFGRHYCAILCPLGIFQSVIGAVFGKNSKQNSNYPKLRYGILCISCLLLVAGWTVGFRLFEPLSRFGFITATITTSLSQWGTQGAYWSISHLVIGGLLPVAALIFLVVWKGRIYCTAICPVGTLLGLCARHSRFRIRFTDACGNCGKCELECPVGCIDAKARVVDSERCVRCLRCFSACKSGGIIYSQTHRALSFLPEIPNPSRRVFLAKSATAAIGVIAIGTVGQGTVRALVATNNCLRNRILPPGAGDSARFARLCTGCQLCVANCPTGIIKPTALGFGPVYVNYSTGGCDYNCTRCNNVCPSGALRPLSLEDKRWLQIGEVVFERSACIVVSTGEPCDLCAKACPVKTIFMNDDPETGLAIPEFNTFHCIGCGICRSVCPAEPKAITVQAVESQQ